MTESPERYRVNFRAYRDDLPSWEDLYNFDISYVDNLFKIANLAIALPNEDFQLKLFLTYALIPSALASAVPYLQLYGVSGSGKSTLGFLASVIHNTEIFASTSTFASIRNFLNHKKFDDGFENNIIMIWDDIDPDIFSEEPDLYRMFKIGYTRQTDKMSVASVGGKNIDFRVFCPKIFSSVHPFFSDKNFVELTRRLIFINTKKASLLGKQELLDLPSFNWANFSRHYHVFWQNEVNCQKYSSHKKSLIRKKPSFLEPEKWQICIDLLATGLTFDIFANKLEAIDFLDKYWQYHEKQIKATRGALYELLETLLAEETANIHELHQLGIKEDLCIRPVVIKRHLEVWQNEGKLETSVNPKMLNKTMASLGFRLSANGWIPIDEN